MDHSSMAGHPIALLTVIIWGLTFISTKILLEDFLPIEILVLRFFIGFVALLVKCPHMLRIEDRRQELEFAAAGLTGVCLYFLLENIALTYTLASNVGVIVAVVPFFTAILSKILLKGEEKLGRFFFAGFVISIVGISLISFGGEDVQVNIVGDVLALLAAFVWAIYSIILKRIERHGYGTIQVTRRCFFYGLLFMIPFACAMGFDPDFGALADPITLGHLLFLGLGASAICFVMWGYVIKKMGAVSTSVYIYLMPVITVAASVVFLGEPLTAVSVLGIAMTLSGLIISLKGTGNSKVARGL